MSDQCKACAGTAPTHTCESYDPAAARRWAAMVRRRASCRVLGWRLWDLPGGDRLVLLPSYGGWILRADDDSALDITRDSARTILRGLLLPQLIEEVVAAREQERARWQEFADWLEVLRMAASSPSARELEAYDAGAIGAVLIVKRKLRAMGVL